MTFPILHGENTLADNGRSAPTDAHAARQNDDPHEQNGLHECWFDALRTPIEIGLVVLRIVEIAILVA
jgi:hypothetical protein